MEKSKLTPGVIEKCATEKRKNRLLNQNSTEKYLSKIKSVLKTFPNLNLCLNCWKVTTSTADTISEKHAKSSTVNLKKILKNKSKNNSSLLMNFINASNPEIQKVILEEIQVASISQGNLRIKPFGFGGNTSCQDEHKSRVEFVKKQEASEVIEIISEKLNPKDEKKKDSNEESLPIDLSNTLENLNDVKIKKKKKEMSPLKKLKTKNLEIDSDPSTPEFQNVKESNDNCKYVLEKDFITQNSKLNKKIQTLVEKNVDMKAEVFKKIDEVQANMSKELTQKLEEFKDGSIKQEEILKLIQEKNKEVFSKSKELITESEIKTKELIENAKSNFIQQISELGESIKNIRSIIDEKKKKKSLNKVLDLSSLFEDEKLEEKKQTKDKIIKESEEFVDLIEDEGKDDSSGFFSDED